jgi:hypothetical protein
MHLLISFAQARLDGGERIRPAAALGARSRRLLHWSLLERGRGGALVGETCQFFFLCNQRGAGSGVKGWR